MPEGEWQVDPGKIDRFRWYDPRDWDWWGPWGRSAWGNWRVPIDRVPSSPKTSRYGFFIHGGSTWGSAGCIDLCRGDESFFRVLETYKQPIPLTVDY